MRKVLQIVLPLCLAALLMWLVLKDTNFEQVGEILSHVNYLLLVASLVPMMMAHVSRAQRWRLLLEPVTVKPTLWESFSAVMSGYLANLALPRLGEVTRCTVLQRRLGIPVEVSLGTVIAERAFDLVMLGLVTVISFLFEFDKLVLFFEKLLGMKQASSGSGNGFSGLLIYFAFFGLGFVLFVFALRKKLSKMPLFVKVQLLFKGLVSGLLSAFRLKQSGQFLLHTFLIWFFYYLSTWLCLSAVPGVSHIGPLGGLLILTVGSFGMVAPVQGGYGPYEFMVISGLTQFYDVPKATAEAAALLMHNSQTAIVVAVGALCFLSILALKPVASTVPVKKQTV